MSRIVRFHELGGPEVLRIEDLSDDAPGPGEVLLRVEAFGVNRCDAQFRRGHYIEQPRLPSRLGYEMAGVVQAIGPDVSGLEVGSAVSTLPAFSLSRYGAYGQTAVVPAAAITVSPLGLSAEQVAALWMSYLTAYGGIAEAGGLDGQSWVLVTAATGGVGRAALQVAKDLGAKVIATTRSADKVAALVEGGADHVVDLSREDLVGRVASITGGRGVNLVFDPIAGGSLTTLAEVAAPGAVIRLYGYFGGVATPLPLIPLLLKGLTVTSFNVFRLTSDARRLAEAKKYIVGGLRRGVLKPVVDRVFPLDDIVAAHAYLEENRQNGKIVVRA